MKIIILNEENYVANVAYCECNVPCHLEGGIELPDEHPVSKGWLYHPETASFTNPQAVEQVEVEPTDIELTRWQFMSLFTRLERTAIRTSADVEIQDFLYMLDIVEGIFLSNSIVIDGIHYAASVLTDFTAERATQILSGETVADTLAGIS